jgi:very-short-patch-repair endonuclease
MECTAIIRLARELRKNQTPTEETLWTILRNRRFERKKFLRQHPIVFQRDSKCHFFIADFYCAEKKLVVELDGKIHDYQKQRDEERDLVIQSMGLGVVRIKNEELDNLEKVKEKIRRHM